MYILSFLSDLPKYEKHISVFKSSAKFSAGNLIGRVAHMSYLQAVGNGWTRFGDALGRPGPSYVSPLFITWGLYFSTVYPGSQNKMISVKYVCLFELELFVNQISKF